MPLCDEAGSCKDLCGDGCFKAIEGSFLVGASGSSVWSLSSGSCMNQCLHFVDGVVSKAIWSNIVV